MKAYFCHVCNNMLDVLMCQSSIRLDGQDYPAHIACAEQWADTMIPVYKVTSPGNGSYYEKSLDNVADMLSNADIDSEYIVTKTQMTRGKYESLEEFIGF